jgi:glycosyltransferase involved in cell wall biosynthesis
MTMDCMPPELNASTLLICVFSYNRVRELDVCLRSIRDMCPGLDVVVVDDGSDLRGTLEVIERHRPTLKDVILYPQKRRKGPRGQLHRNIAAMDHYATERGYNYLFLVQDDMQFVRPLDERVRGEYERIFTSEPDAIQVDTRFLRHTGEIVVLPSTGAYRYADHDDRGSYSDVGITYLPRLHERGWFWLRGERPMKVAAHQRGLKRIFPFTPIMMHVPYPTIYRRREKLRRLEVFGFARGRYRSRYFSADEIERMDGRPLEELPYAKDLLTPIGAPFARLRYRLDEDSRIYT